MEGAIKQLINQRNQLIEVVAVKQEEIRKLTETIQHLASMEPSLQIPEELKKEKEIKEEASKPDNIKEANEPKIIKNGQAQNELDIINKKAQTSNKNKWTVIFDGPMSGVYKDWNIAAQFIKGINHCSYNTKGEAEEA